jgi:uncharacterized protein YggL (DUF469 family)
MDIVTVFFEVIRVIFGLLSLFFIPGFAITLVYFPRLTEIRIVQRVIYSVGLSIIFVIVAVLFLVGVLGVDTTSRNMDLVIAVFLAIMLVIWLSEVFSLNKTVRKKYSRFLHAATDSRQPAITKVVWHESQRSGMNLIDHSYLLDAGREMDIQQVIEHTGKISEIKIVQPPHPRTRYFELTILEYKEKGLSLVDDLQVYPVLVTKKPDITFLGFLIKRGSSVITKRLYKKERMAEVQWIFSHDFHLFAITDSDDSLDQMVDRIIAKIDEIVTSQRSGSRISSHLEVTQTLREAFDTVMEKPKTAIPNPLLIKIPPRAVEARQTIGQQVKDNRKLQKEIVRDLNTFNLTPESFSHSDRLITTIKIPEKADVNKQLARIKEILNDDWLYE